MEEGGTDSEGRVTNLHYLLWGCGFEGGWAWVMTSHTLLMGGKGGGGVMKSLEDELT